MVFLSYFIEAVAELLNTLISVYIFILIVRALISWVNPDPYNPIVRFLYQVTEPVLYPIRRVIPIIGGIDFSVMVAILLLYFIRAWLIRYLYYLARAVAG